MAKQVRLSQVIAIEKQVKVKVNSETATLHKANQNGDLFSGMSRTYSKKDEDGDSLPGESKLVQKRASEQLEKFSLLWAELIDIVSTKDYGNCEASADIIVDGKTLVTKVPVTHLVWLEKQLDDAKTYIANLPVTDPDKEWKFNANTKLFETEPVVTVRHKKVPQVFVKAQATEQHPAQTELVSVEVLAGHWTTVIKSGGLAPSRKEQLLQRIDSLKKGVKSAREEANTLKLDEYNVGSKLAEYLFA